MIFVRVFFQILVIITIFSFFLTYYSFQRNFEKNYSGSFYEEVINVKGLTQILVI